MNACVADCIVKEPQHCSTNPLQPWLELVRHKLLRFPNCLLIIAIKLKVSILQIQNIKSTLDSLKMISTQNKGKQKEHVPIFQN